MTYLSIDLHFAASESDCVLNQGVHTGNIQANRGYVRANVVELSQLKSHIAIQVAHGGVSLDTSDYLGDDLIQVGQRKIAAGETLADSNELS